MEPQPAAHALVSADLVVLRRGEHEAEADGRVALDEVRDLVDGSQAVVRAAVQRHHHRVQVLADGVQLPRGLQQRRQLRGPPVRANTNGSRVTPHSTHGHKHRRPRTATGTRTTALTATYRWYCSSFSRLLTKWMTPRDPFRTLMRTAPLMSPAEGRPRSCDVVPASTGRLWNASCATGSEHTGEQRAHTQTSRAQGPHVR